jgi:poly(3-hydroxybutyrate) depolymerase
MTMNLDRHVAAHKDLFQHLVSGDGDGAEKHREFYDEYLAVMDLTAEFFLQTVDTVFVNHRMPKGEMMHGRRRVDLSRIRRVALMTIEGEKDDITGVGQCRAAHDLCTHISDSHRVHFECPKVGHYGIFNGSRFRREIASRIADFTRLNDGRTLRGVVSEPIERRGASQTPADFAKEPSSAAFNFGANPGDRRRTRTPAPEPADPVA